MKRSVILLFTIVFSCLSYASSLSKDNQYQISGVVSFTASDKYIYLVQFTGDEVLSVDSALVKNGKFKFQGIASEQDFVSLVYGNYPEEVISCDLMLDAGKIKVKMSDSLSIVSGTPLNDLYAAIEKKRDERKDEIKLIPVTRLYRGEQWSESSKQKKDSIYQTWYEEELEIIKKNIHNAVGKQLYKDWMQAFAHINISKIDYLAFYNLGDERLKQDPGVLSELQYLEGRDKNVAQAPVNHVVKVDSATYDSIMLAKKAQIPYTDFTFHSVSGDPVSLSSFVGKSDYLLVEFWASWCGPCKQVIPFFKEQWAKHDRKELNIISISLDSDEGDWKNEMKKQKMPWPQFVMKGEGWKRICELYNHPSGGIPFTIVIKKDGILDNEWLWQLNNEPAK